MNDIDDVKKHGITVTLSSVATLIPVGAAVWFILQPLMVSQISSALAEDFTKQIEDQTEPVQNAFKVLLLSDINRLKRSISRLEFKEEHEPDEWSEDDAIRLSDYRIELESFQEAYGDL